MTLFNTTTNDFQILNFLLTENESWLPAEFDSFLNYYEHTMEKSNPPRISETDQCHSPTLSSRDDLSSLSSPNSPFFSDEDSIMNYHSPVTPESEDFYFHSPSSSLDSSNNISSTTTTTAGTSTTQTMGLAVESPLRCNTKTPRKNYNRWTEEEDGRLKDAVEFHVGRKWNKVAALVQNRTGMQCFARWNCVLNTDTQKGKWSTLEDENLLNSIDSMLSKKDLDKTQCDKLDCQNWSEIAVNIVGRTGVQCNSRYLEALDPAIKKGKWSTEEDSLLLDGMKRFGTAWVEIAAMIPTRTQRQIRTRWIHLRKFMK